MSGQGYQAKCQASVTVCVSFDHLGFGRRLSPVVPASITVNAALCFTRQISDMTARETKLMLGRPVSVWAWWNKPREIFHGLRARCGVLTQDDKVPSMENIGDFVFVTLFGVEWLLLGVCLFSSMGGLKAWHTHTKESLKHILAFGFWE